MRALVSLANDLVLDRLPPGLRRFALYLFCGGIAASADFIVYAALVGFGIWYQVANAAGYVTGTVASFLLNRAITFQVKDAPIRRLFTFLGVALIGFLSSSAVLWLLVERFYVDELVAKILSFTVVLAVQFTLNSLVTFRAAKEAAQQ